MNEAQVSCITVFYNEEKFLSEAIESVLAQSYENWELLLVDDGSNDASREIAYDYVGKFPKKLRYLEHDGHINRGISTTRNLGIQNAKGKYIAFLDADDIWLPHKLERQIAILESRPSVALLYGRTLLWRSWRGKPGDRNRDIVLDARVEPGILLKSPEFLRFFVRQKVLAPPPSSMVMRKKILKHIGGFVENSPSAIEDQVFIAKFCLQAPLMFIAEVFEKYRIHPNSCIARATSREICSARQFYLIWLKNYLVDVEISDKKLDKAIAMESLLCKNLTIYRLRRFCMQMMDVLLFIGRRILPSSIRKWLWVTWQGKMYKETQLKKNRKDFFLSIARWILSASTRKWLWKQWVSWKYPVRFGNFRRVTPLNENSSSQNSVDSYYIESFLGRHSADIRGQILEDGAYATIFGKARVVKREILGLANRPTTTVIADLKHIEKLPENTFDCIILAHTLSFICEVQDMVEVIYRILKPAGVALVLLPGMTVAPRLHRYWAFSELSAQKLYCPVFGKGNVEVTGYGNVLATTVLLHNLPARQLRQKQLDYRDPAYDIIIGVRAVKPTEEK